jgi:hypothetical protein
VVRVENRTDNPDLEAGATTGKAPPRLGGLLPDSDFQGRAGITLSFIKAPAGSFTSYPDRSTYALLVKAPGDEALDALYALRRGLPHAEGDAPWLDASTFMFPVEPVALAAAQPALPLPPCVPQESKGKGGKDWCWCKQSDGSKSKGPC